MVKTGWLDPSGDFYPCCIMEHYAWAKEYLNDLKNAFDDHRNISGKDAEQILIDAGWVQITRSMIGNQEYSIFWSLEKRLTEYQENFLKPIFEDTKTDIGFSSRCHWEHDMNL